MQKVTLTKIYTTDKDKAGNPLMSKTGKPYTRMSIKTEEYGDKYISGFKNKANESWKEGDTVEVIIEEKGEYLNFSMPKEEDKQAEIFAKLHYKVTSVELRLGIIEEHLGIKSSEDYKDIPAAQARKDDPVDYPEEPLDMEDIPF